MSSPRESHSDGASGTEPFPPDCKPGDRCLKCRKCYSRYVELKMGGALKG